MNHCARAPHANPPHLMEILPPLREQPEITAALAAAYAGCRECMAYDRRQAGNAPDAVHWTMTLFLLYAAIILNAHGRPPGANADAMVEALSPATHKLLSAPTHTILLFLPVWTTTDTPDGTPAAKWDRDRLGAALAEISPRHREMVWTETTAALTGIIQGEGRARQGAAQ